MNLCYCEESKLKGTRAVFVSSVLTCAYTPFESSCNGAIGQTTEDALPAGTSTKGEARRPMDLLYLYVSQARRTVCVLLLLPPRLLEALVESSPALTRILSLH